MREEALAAKLSSNAELNEKMGELKKAQAALEDLKHQHYVVTAEQIQKLSKEKAELKENFDVSIDRLKEAHSKDVGELQTEIQRQRERA